MNEKYAWTSDSSPAFFDEGGGERSIDLASFQYDTDAAHGMLHRIVTGCRVQLAGLGVEEIRAILRLADTTLFSMLPAIKLVGSDGAPITVQEVDWSSANQLDFIHLLIAMFGNDRFLVADEQFPEVEPWELSPARFCAAYALRMAFNASRDYLSWEEARDLREYYLAQSAVAFGLMQSLEADKESGIPGALHMVRSVNTSRVAARKRWDSSPKSEAMAAIREEWETMCLSQRHLSDAEFARRAMERYGEIITNEGSIKNAISRWRKAASSC